MLTSMVWLSFGNVSSLDGRSMERKWNNSANMEKTSFTDRERWVYDGLILTIESTEPMMSFSPLMLHARQNETEALVQPTTIQQLPQDSTWRKLA